MPDLRLLKRTSKTPERGLSAFHRTLRNHTQSIAGDQIDAIRSDAALRRRWLGWTVTLFGIGLMGAGTALMMSGL